MEGNVLYEGRASLSLAEKNRAMSIPRAEYQTHHKAMEEEQDEKC